MGFIRLIVGCCPRQWFEFATYVLAGVWCICVYGLWLVIGCGFRVLFGCFWSPGRGLRTRTHIYHQHIVLIYITNICDAVAAVSRID